MPTFPSSFGPLARLLKTHVGAALLVLAALLVPTFAASEAQADAQASLRGFLEFGKQTRGGGDVTDFIVGLGSRGDVLFGAAKPNSFRLGPAYELRTVDFWSAEGGLGLSALIPLGFTDLPLVITGIGGYAVRRQGPETPMAIGIVSWGWRGYNYHSAYGWALNVFFSGRKSISGTEVVEFTGGVECDLQFLTIVPFLAIRNAIFGKDPYETIK